MSIVDEKAKLKRQLFDCLESDICRLEKEIKFARFNGIKDGAEKAVKVVGNILHGIYPYAICAGLTIGAGLGTGVGMPFVKSECKVYENYATEMSSATPKPTTETSFQELSAKNEVRVFGNWRQNASGYERNVETYSISDGVFLKLNENQMQEIVQKKDLKAIADLIGEPIKSLQTSEKIPSAESMAKDFRLVEATLTGRNNNFRMQRMTTGEAVMKTVVEVFLALLCMLVPLNYRLEKDYSMFKNIRETLHRDETKLSVKDLKKAFAIKKQNYKMLGGGL
jgi:hypothetical protein